MPVNKLQDGEPLTYDFINAMVDDIIKLRSSVSQIRDKQSSLGETDDTSEGQIIRVLGATETTAQDNQLNQSDVLIKIGVKSFSPQDLKNKGKFHVPLGSSFAAPPLVVASLADERGDDDQTPFVNLVVSNVGKQKFTIKFNVISSINEKSGIKVNYIAIGKYKTKNT